MVVEFDKDFGLKLENRSVIFCFVGFFKFGLPDWTINGFWKFFVVISWLGEMFEGS